IRFSQAVINRFAPFASSSPPQTQPNLVQRRATCFFNPRDSRLTERDQGMPASLWRRLSQTARGLKRLPGSSYRYRTTFDFLEDRLVPSGDPLAGISSSVSAHILPLASDFLGQQAVQTTEAVAGLRATPGGHGIALGSVKPAGGTAPGGGFAPSQIRHA